jgi:hypothetical protein
MLRMMLGEPRRKDDGALAAAGKAVGIYLEKLESVPAGERTPQERRYIIWSRSFIRAMDELEQSQYAAVRFGGKVTKAYIDEMLEEECDDYHRHLYFYKNAIIRLFSILDKLGHFMNERFRLKTEAIKPRFSYFTVLRNLHQHKLHLELEQKLFKLKGKYEEPVSRLRIERNMEIHTINADLLDDLLRAAESAEARDQRIRTDNIKEQLIDLAFGCEMAFTAVETVFAYIDQLSDSSEQPSAAQKLAESG